MVEALVAKSTLNEIALARVHAFASFVDLRAIHSSSMHSSSVDQRLMPRGSMLNRSIAAVSLLTVLACSAAGNDVASSKGTAGAGAGGATPAVPGAVARGVGPGLITQCQSDAPVSAGPAPIRRISAVEYQAAVRDLFGVTVNLAAPPADELLGNFVTNLDTRLTEDNLRRYVPLANDVAGDVVANFAARSSCADVADVPCVESFLINRARRAFHGVLEPADEALLLGLHAGLLAGADAPAALHAALRFILLSPRFLYLIDFGSSERGRALLEPSELAGRLAAFLWRGVPDDELLRAADSAELADPEQVKAQALRMLEDERAQPMLASFVKQLLSLATTTGQDVLSAQLDAEPGELFAIAVRSGAGVFGDLLASRAALPHVELEQFYGATSGNVPAEHAGLVLRGSFLRTHTSAGRPSPIKRGHAVRKAFLCDVVAPPSAGVNMNIPVPAAGQSERAAFGAHSGEPACWGCHQWMDPLGHTFAAYDATGRYSASDVDASATLYPSSVAPLPRTELADTQALMDFLAASEFSQQCLALQTGRFALGRAEAAEDACAVKSLWEAFDASSLNLRQLIIELTASDYFRYRSPVEAGGTCR